MAFAFHNPHPHLYRQISHFHSSLPSSSFPSHMPPRLPSPLILFIDTTVRKGGKFLNKFGGLLLQYLRAWLDLSSWHAVSRLSKTV